MSAQRNSGALVRFICALMLAAFVAAPALLVYPLAFSASRFLTLNTGGISYQWFVRALNPPWASAVATSTMLALATAFCAIAVGAPAAYYSTKVNLSSLTLVLDFTSLALLVAPPISLAVGFFRAYGEGSIIPLLIGHIALAFPYVYLSLRSGFNAVGDQVSEAASLLGSGDWSTLLHVMIPASRKFVALAFALAFLLSWDESVFSVFNTPPGLTTLPKLIWETMQRERDLTAAAINAIVAPFFSLALIALFTALHRQKATQ